MALLVPAGRPGELSRRVWSEQGPPAHPASSSSMRRRTVPQSSSPNSPDRTRLGRLEFFAPQRLDRLGVVDGLVEVRQQLAGNVGAVVVRQ